MAIFNQDEIFDTKRRLTSFKLVFMNAKETRAAY